MAASASSSEVTGPAFTPIDAIPGIVTAAREVFNSGRTRPLEWRINQIKGLRRLCNEQGAMITAALGADLRRPECECVLYETMVCLSEVNHALSHIKTWAANRAVPTPPALLPASSYVKPEPLGVILIIAPWNFPIQLVITPLVAALAAGNTVVIKPSELSPACARFLTDTLPRYVDADAVRIVNGGADETTRLLAQRFDHILYTGGGVVATHVLRAAAAHLTPVTLELGGKCPAFVDEGANMAMTARRILAGKVNAGQACVSPDYVLVAARARDALVAALTAAMTEFYGADAKASPDVGRIINRRHFARLAALLESSGGKVVAGGATDAAELYVAPTIILEPRRDAPIMNEEIFGPLLPVLAVADMDEAMAFINAKPKPLAAYIFTPRGAAAARFVSGVAAGGMCVNDTFVHAGVPDLPFGGVGASGMGAYHGQWGFDTFSHKKAVLEMPTWIDTSKLRFPPYTAARTRLLATLLTAMPNIPLPGVKDVLIAGLAAAVIVLSVRLSQQH